MVIQDLISILRGIPAAEFTPAGVQTLLADVNVDTASLERYMFWAPRRYTRNLIYRDEMFELIAMCWESGCASHVHNHSGQDCWLYVHEGTLCVDSFDLVDPSQAGRVGDNIVLRKTERLVSVGRGTVDHRGPANDIHRVMNRRAEGKRAISLHVYSRPFDDCIIYEPSARRALHKTMCYDSREGKRCQPVTGTAAGPAITVSPLG
ncbi:MAG TPA: cysteine dioxygenase family protein [Myxococcota bacterium]|nr:cysteine dioxygenase family protein [Myxococcota bacterium]